MKNGLDYRESKFMTAWYLPSRHCWRDHIVGVRPSAAADACDRYRVIVGVVAPFGCCRVAWLRRRFGRRHHSHRGRFPDQCRYCRRLVEFSSSEFKQVTFQQMLIIGLVVNER